MESYFGMAARTFLAVALVAWAWCRPLLGASFAAGDYRFTAGSSALCIPFDPTSRQISLQARVNGHDKVWLTLDSGSEGSVLDSKLASALGLKAVGRQRSLGAGGEQEGSTVRGVDVELQGFELLDQAMDALSLEALSAQAGRRMDGIIGHPIFERCVVQIDYTRHCLSLFDTSRFEYAGRGAVIPIELIDSHPYVTASVVLPGGRSITGRFVIDTGGSSSLIFSSEVIEREGIQAVMGKTLSVQGHGVGGGTELRLGRVDRLDLGGFSLVRPIAMLKLTGAGRVSAPGTLGNIGAGVLSRFTVIFDYARRRMILEPGPDLAEAFESDMSGLSLVTAPPEFRTVRVARVMDDSPGVDAGVRAGDVIEAVDGTPADEIGVPALRERLRREGQVIRLGVLRGTERILVTLRTRRMI